ncbi:type II toxin-antitoxin system PemK/MazF family toxin [Lacticaseibacillus sharpeae]|uniref:type II toxin-antitoxin system PemK/MazF family toxin n=1 Tax=Lacticaseibacillus sharpeae TaxID=1626 RepID=UPI0006D03E34|nr:type II toxin-antitoxin system PemK/MazF family toxin [Lacticaseibacillus sharpeae]
MTQTFPKQGEVLMIDAEPHAGKEFGGHDPQSGNIQRPFIVLSKSGYNKSTGMIIGMVTTTTDDPAMSELLYMRVPERGVAGKLHGRVVLWQLPNFDFKARHARVTGRVSTEILQVLLASVRDLFE